MAGVDCLPEEINVLTLNCWGIPYVCPNRSDRLEEIGRRIVKSNPQPHIVGLQECISKTDFEHIQQETRSILPYSKQYFAGPLGTGLALLSRWPIEEISITRYPLNGSPTALFHGDWYAGKGVAYAKVRYGKEPDNIIDVFNTHLHAFYPGHEYLCHRVSQAWELSKFLRGASQRRHDRALVVLLGDLNAEPTSLPYRILRHFVPDIHDTWLQHSLRHKKPPKGSQGGSNTREDDTNVQSGVTYGSPYNTWMWTRAQRARYLRQPGAPVSELGFPAGVGREQVMRIDYVLANVTPRYLKDIEIGPYTDRFGSGKDTGGTSKVDQGRGVWTVKSAKVGMVDRHPVLGCSLSDHFSVETTLAFQKIGKGVPISRQLSNEPRGADHRAFTGLKEDAGSETHVQELQGALELGELPGEPNTIELLDEIIHVLGENSKILQQRSWWRRARLGVAGIVLAGSLVGVWVVGVPGWARFLLALAGALASACAAVDAWAGISLYPTETAALEEFEWEVKNAKRSCDSVTSL
ncbi:Endonuclease/exonuclease/phosphatase [Annulohypoxylon maeteangense]|uniref:Endonuclease/exonuclease/phosphatase n=1 Tax=Annulohypoxylon maeteangense TaxID=1927788 RepID=UPI002007AE46|nr:Endonuclease/exonuclease/phosphatase [Annulohypoxylon maeteangense]KAI0885971.1 Endonuclease/exonuclease/phosphatase [Annulohypoxylon maeteangense]